MRTTKVDPVEPDLKRFLSESPHEPFVMLNLVRYAEDGRRRYTEYLRAARPLVERAGGRVIYFGAGLPSLVPGADAGGDWDAVLLVSYPSPAAFLEMIRDPEYVAVSELRTGALSAAVLQPTRPVGLSRRTRLGPIPKAAITA